MPDSLYETDVLAWSEHQADLLRRLAHGERLNETIDWENVIEEVESVGRSELYGSESLLEQALIHLLKLHLAPHSRSAAHWRGEISTFLGGARRRFAPSMRQRIDLAGLYGGVLSRLRAEARGKHDARLPPACPSSWTICWWPSPTSRRCWRSSAPPEPDDRRRDRRRSESCDQPKR